MFICSNWLTKLLGGHFWIIVKSLTFHSPLNVLFFPRRFISLSTFYSPLDVLFPPRRFISLSEVLFLLWRVIGQFNEGGVAAFRVLELLPGFWKCSQGFGNAPRVLEMVPGFCPGFRRCSQGFGVKCEHLSDLLWNVL